MTTTIKDVLKSIKSLAETQEKGSREVNQKIKKIADAQDRNEEIRKKSMAELDQKIKKVTDGVKKVTDAQDRNEEIRKKSMADLDQRIKKVADAQDRNEEIRKKSMAELDQKIKKVTDAQDRNEEIRKKNMEELDQKIKKVADGVKKVTDAQDRNEEIRKKNMAKAEQAIKEAEESQKQLQKSLNKFIGDSGLQWGKFVEALANTGTVRLLKEQGIEVETTSIHVKDESPHRRYEIDILAINGKEMVAVEAKKYLKKKDIDEAFKRFNIFKQYNKEANRKILYGAVAYLNCEKNANLYAEKKGLFVIQVTGNSATMNVAKDFKPQPLSSHSK